MLANTLQDDKGYVDAKEFSAKLYRLFDMIRKRLEYDEELTELEATFLLKYTHGHLERSLRTSTKSGFPRARCTY